MDDSESPVRRRTNVKASLTDKLQLGFALLLFPILYILVIYSLLTFVWSATISPLRINQLLFPRLVTSSYSKGTPCMFPNAYILLVVFIKPLLLLDGKERPVYLLVTDAALLVLFALFHTGMATRVYKRLLHHFHMVPFIRASYILVTCTLIQVSGAMVVCVDCIGIIELCDMNFSYVLCHGNLCHDMNICYDIN